MAPRPPRRTTVTSSPRTSRIWPSSRSSRCVKLLLNCMAASPILSTLVPSTVALLRSLAMSTLSMWYSYSMVRMPPMRSPTDSNILKVLRTDSQASSRPLVLSCVRPIMTVLLWMTAFLLSCLHSCSASREWMACASFS